MYILIILIHQVIFVILNTQETLFFANLMICFYNKLYSLNQTQIVLTHKNIWFVWSMVVKHYSCVWFVSCFSDKFYSHKIDF